MNPKNLILVTFLALALGLLGCAKEFLLNPSSTELDDWMGHPQSELLLKWGPAQATAPDAKGGTILIYRGSESTSTVETRYWFNGQYYDESPERISTFSYRKMLYADPKGNIYSWAWSNSEGYHDDLESFVTRVSIHAEQGDPSAARWLGFWYADGSNGLAQDYALAMRWDLLAANHGLVDAENNLGLCYYQDESLRDYGKAFYWFKKSAEQGYSCGEFDLGLCYEKGNGVVQDLKKARYWYQKAARQGNTPATQSLEKIESEITNENAKGR